MNALSLFSCIGVSEFYLEELGINIVVANDIDKKRCDVHQFLYPKTTMVCCDITSIEGKKQIFNAIGQTPLDIIISTPPCQGLSTVGKNKGVNLVYTKDKRNYLILETFDFIDRYQPKYVVFENVPQLLKIKLDFNGKLLSIKEILMLKYGNNYEILFDIFNTSDFEIPQNRERVFIRLIKKGLKWTNPIKSQHIITLREAIGDLPSLEPGESSNLKNHWARKHPLNQIEWMRHTPTGCSAFRNDVYYPVKDNGDRIKGYPNCYKRMIWDAPSPTITMRNEIMSSQDKVHPGRPLGNGLWSDARVLTLRELLIIMSLPGDLDLPTNVSDSQIRQYIGEGIPPRMMKIIFQNLLLL